MSAFFFKSIQPFFRDSKQSELLPQNICNLTKDVFYDYLHDFIERNPSVGPKEVTRYDTKHFFVNHKIKLTVDSNDSSFLFCLSAIIPSS